MGGLSRGPLDHGAAHSSRWCAPLPAGCKVLSDTAVAPGCKILVRDGWMVATVRLDEPASGGFDAVYVAPCDVVAAMNAVGRE